METIEVYSENQKKHINAERGKSAELLVSRPAVHIVTTKRRS